MDSTSKIDLEVVTENKESRVVRSISPEDQRTVLQILIDEEITIDHSCGGNGTCGTCRFFHLGSPEALKPRTEIEVEMAEDRSFEDRDRLACQTWLQGSTKIKLPDYST